MTNHIIPDGGSAGRLQSADNSGYVARMAPPVLALTQIRLAIGAKTLFEDAGLEARSGERICLVGRNGSGKSTLLRIAAGEIEPDAGTRFLQPGASLRYLPQEPDLAGFPNVGAYVEAGLNASDDPHRARRLIERLGLDGGAELARLSGGEARRAALARALAADPDVLLLDEPTNHLDLPTIEWLEAEIAGMRAALVLVSHDRRFLERLSRVTVWLEGGRARRLERGFDAFETWRDQILAQDEADRHKLDRKILREEDWVRYGVTARRKRNQGRLAALAKLRAERRARGRPRGDARFSAADAGHSGKLVIEAEGIGFSHGGRPITRNFSLRALRGDRIGIVGGNGAGKTTMLKLLTGALAPQTGRVAIGANVAIATLDQGREALDPEWTLQRALTGGAGDTVTINGATRHIVSWMKDFLFAPEQAGTPVSRLSGGERGRLALARLLSLPSNLLALDEPTNDLDIETLDLLQEMIAEYPGAALIVSHDRDFLDRVATSILMSEGEGRWIEYAGGYSDMLAQRGAGVEAAAPPRPAPRAAKAPPSARAAGKRRLSFKEKHALETLPARIEALGERRALLQARLDDPTLYARERAAFDRAMTDLAAVAGELAAAEDEWLALELLREEIES